VEGDKLNPPGNHLGHRPQPDGRSQGAHSCRFNLLIVKNVSDLKFVLAATFAYDQP
jgi:hypothetical protein